MAATIANWWENRQDRLQYNERLQKYRDTQMLRQASADRYRSMIGISRKSPIYKDIIFYLKNRLIILKNPKKSNIASRFSSTVKNSFRSKSSVRSSRIRKSRKSRKSSTVAVFKKMSRKDKNRYIDGQNAFRFYYKLEITANTVKPGICKGYNKRSKYLEVAIDKKIYRFPGGYYDIPGRCTCGDCFLNGSAENEIELIEKILSRENKIPIFKEKFFTDQDFARAERDSGGNFLTPPAPNPTDLQRMMRTALALGKRRNYSRRKRAIAVSRQGKGGKGGKSGKSGKRRRRKSYKL